MKKLLLSVFAMTLLATVFVSCDRLGLNDPAMDSEEATTKVKEAVAKNVDATKWKILKITWNEGSELSNKLGSIYLRLVNKEGNYFTQRISYNKEHELMAEEVKEPIISERTRDQIVYEEVVGIDCNKLDGKTTVKHIEAVKALISEEYEFKSVESYNIEKYMNPIIKLNVFKKGEETKMEERNITTNYYSILFTMKEDGSWEAKE